MEQSIECWSCSKNVAISRVRECDGYCPACDAPIDFDEDESDD